MSSGNSIDVRLAEPPPPAVMPESRLPSLKPVWVVR